MTIQQDLTNMTNELKSFTAEMRKFTQAQSASTRDTYVYSEAVSDAQDRVSKLSKQYEKRKTQSDEEIRLQQRILKLRADEARFLEETKKHQKAMQNLRDEYKRGSITEADYRQQRKAGLLQIRTAKQNQTTAANAANASAIKLGQSFNGTRAGFNRFVGGLANAGKSLLAFNQVFLNATTASSGVIEAAGTNFDQSLTNWIANMTATGADGDKALAIMAANRQVVNAMGGMDNAIRGTEKTFLAMRGFYGSLEESIKGNMGILTQFANKGVKPTQRAMQAYNADLTTLAIQTGLSATAINSMIDSIANDTDSLTILRAAREDEREAILANQRALLKSNIALGMTAEQASEASKMLNKMVAQKPLERLKQAAKMRAMGAAMGLGPDAEKAAQAITAGKRATGQQKEDLNNFNIKLTGLADQASQQGLGQELFVSTMLDKLDLDQYYGSGSAFSATLGTELKQNQEALVDQYQSSSDSIVVEVNNVADILTNVLKAITDGTYIWTTLVNVISASANYTSDLFDRFAANFKDLGAEFHNLGQVIQHPFSAENRQYEATDNQEKLETEIRIRQDKQEAQAKEISVMRQAKLDQIKNKAEAYPKPISTPVQLPALQDQHAKQANITTPTPVKVIANPIKEATDKTNHDKSLAIASDHTELLTNQNTKIDSQLLNMNKSNELLQILADAAPVMIDLTQKQLLMLSLDSSKRGNMINKLRSQQPSFQLDYQYDY